MLCYVILYYIVLNYIILFYTSDNFRKPHETFRKLFENLRNPLETFKNKLFIETFRNLWKPIGALWKLFRKPSEHRQTLRNQTFGNLSKTFGEVFCSGSREAVRTVGSIGSVGSAVGSVSVGSAVGSVVGSVSQLSVLQSIFGWLCCLARPAICSMRWMVNDGGVAHRTNDERNRISNRIAHRTRTRQATKASGCKRCSQHWLNL